MSRIKWSNKGKCYEIAGQAVWSEDYIDSIVNNRREQLIWDTAAELAKMELEK